MKKLPRYSIKTEQTAAGVQVGMTADPAGEYVRVDELQFFVTQFFGKPAMEFPASFPEEKAERPSMDKPHMPSAPAKKVPVAKKGIKQGAYDDQEIAYLRGAYQSLTVARMAQSLKRTEVSVFQKLQHLGLKAMSSKKAELADTASKPEGPESFDPSNPFIRQIPESAKPGSGRQVTWS